MGILSAAPAREETQVEEAVTPRLVLLRQLHQAVVGLLVAVEQRGVAGLALVAVLGAAEVERRGRR